MNFQINCRWARFRTGISIQIYGGVINRWIFNLWPIIDRCWIWLICNVSDSNHRSFGWRLTSLKKKWVFLISESFTRNKNDKECLENQLFFFYLKYLTQVEYVCTYKWGNQHVLNWLYRHINVICFLSNVLYDLWPLYLKFVEKKQRLVQIHKSIGRIQKFIRINIFKPNNPSHNFKVKFEERLLQYT